MLNSVVSFLSTHAISLVAGGAGALVLNLAISKIPGLIGSRIEKELEKALSDIDDPANKELALAILKWVEVKIPDAGTKHEKFEKAAALLTKKIPLNKEKVAELLEAVVGSVDKAAKDTLKK